MTSLAWLLALDWKTFAALVATLVGAATLLGILHRKILIPLGNLIKHAWNCFLRAEQYMVVLDQIAAEFRPNGGSSMKDALNRLEKRSVTRDANIQAIMNYQRMAVWESDKDGGCVWASDALLELTGLTMDQMRGNGWSVAVPEEERERVFTEWQAAVEQHREFHARYHVGIKTPVPVIGRAYLVKDHHGTITGFVGTLEPITDSKALAANAAGG